MNRGVWAAVGTTVLLGGAFLAPAAPGGSNEVVASATGSGHMVRNGFYRTFSFTAQKHVDGTSQGQLQLRSPEFGVVVHLAIDCLRVVGNRAHMSGVITYTSNTDEAFVGERVRTVLERIGQEFEERPHRVVALVEPTCFDDPEAEMPRRRH